MGEAAGGEPGVGSADTGGLVLSPSPLVGATLRKAVRGATVEVVEGMIQLSESILRAPQQSLSQEQLISTGGVWEACDRISCLPRDNQAAVALAISSYLGIVRDALEEMEQVGEATAATLAGRGHGLWGCVTGEHGCQRNPVPELGIIK
ncbi:hypothetical protein EYD10_17398 [Varanus komodoensis]|nr:hypothetical protein EYD10_17398 [Varanus komodoensis]